MRKPRYHINVKRITEGLLLRWLCPHHFLILMVTSVSLSLVSGYVIAVGSSNVASWFPYITYKTTEPPASCVFGILLNLSVMFALICIYIRHRYLECDALNNQLNYVINDVAVFLGLVTCFMIIVLTCLQLTKASMPHFFGAFFVYIFANIYCWIQSYLTYATIGNLSTKRQTVFRVIVCGISTMSFILTSALGSEATSKARDVENIKATCVWTSDDPGYSAHVGSSFFQWIMTLSLLFYFLTFYTDFKRTSCQVKITTTKFEENPENKTKEKVVDIEYEAEREEDAPEEEAGSSSSGSSKHYRDRRRSGRVNFDSPELSESPPVHVHYR